MLEEKYMCPCSLPKKEDELEAEKLKKIILEKNEAIEKQKENLKKIESLYEEEKNKGKALETDIRNIEQELADFK